MQTMSGPRESPSHGSVDRPWSGKNCVQVTPLKYVTCIKKRQGESW